MYLEPETEETENKRPEWSEKYWVEIIAHTVFQMLHCVIFMFVPWIIDD